MTHPGSARKRSGGPAMPWAWRRQGWKVCHSLPSPEASQTPDRSAMTEMLGVCMTDATAWEPRGSWALERWLLHPKTEPFS